MTRKVIEERVEKILAEYNISSTPTPIEEIAKRHGISIAKASSNKFSGLLFRKEDGPAFIALNSGESLVRQRFTVAHELGHYFLHPNNLTSVYFRDDKKNLARGPKEIQANQFAAALLMPKKLLERDVSTIAGDGISEDHVNFLAKKYRVSSKAMNFRLINLHLI